MYIHMCMYMCIYIYIYMYLSLYISIYLSISLSLSLSLSIYIYIYIHGYGPHRRRRHRAPPAAAAASAVRSPRVLSRLNEVWADSNNNQHSNDNTNDYILTLLLIMIMLTITIMSLAVWICWRLATLFHELTSLSTRRKHTDRQHAFYTRVESNTTPFSEHSRKSKRPDDPLIKVTSSKLTQTRGFGHAETAYNKIFCFSSFCSFSLLLSLLLLLLLVRAQWLSSWDLVDARPLRL